MSADHLLRGRCRSHSAPRSGRPTAERKRPCQHHVAECSHRSGTVSLAERFAFPVTLVGVDFCGFGIGIEMSLTQFSINNVVSYASSSILAICALFMVIATVCEWRTRTQPQSLSSASMKLKSSSTSNGHAYSISSLNSNLSNNNNNGSNGHLKGHPNMEFHGTTQMELHHIRQSNDNGFAATSPESTTPVSVESRKLGKNL